MESLPTAGRPALQVRIADSLRADIETGVLRPGDALPTLQSLTDKWQCSMSPVREAFALLREQGLISSHRGKPSRVRIKPRQVVRSSERHQHEKDLVLLPEKIRGATGTSETEMKAAVVEFDVLSDYSVVPADADVAGALRLNEGEPVLRRCWEHVNLDGGQREAWSVSHIPESVVRGNPDLYRPELEPWPGGTQHQLFTVGIELMNIVDEVTAHMPTTAEAERWELEPGIPMIRCRRISFDQHSRPVEISDAEYPADRTMLSFTTPLRPWE